MGAVRDCPRCGDALMSDCGYYCFGCLRWVERVPPSPDEVPGQLLLSPTVVAPLE